MLESLNSMPSFISLQVHHGLVLLSDGKGQPRPARLELTQDTLAVQVPVGYAGAVHTEETGVERGVQIHDCSSFFGHINLTYLTLSGSECNGETTERWRIGT